MQNQHRKAFASLMTGIGELYGRSISPELISIYWDGLRDFDFEDVKAAINLHVRNPDTGQFMPKIADVVKFIEGNSATKAMRAWQVVLDTVRLVGTYQSVVFDDYLIHATVNAMGGWQSIGLIGDDELRFKANEFERRYQSFCLKPPAHYPRKLTGYFEQENAKTGFPSGQPVMIGNPERARLVYEGGGNGAELLTSMLDVDVKLIPASAAA
jgi:hypothetical protein